MNRYPREKSQGVAFEKSIAPVDLIISLECKPVGFWIFFFGKMRVDNTVVIIFSPI